MTLGCVRLSGGALAGPGASWTRDPAFAPSFPLTAAAPTNRGELPLLSGSPGSSEQTCPGPRPPLHLAPACQSLCLDTPAAAGPVRCHQDVAPMPWPLPRPGVFFLSSLSVWCFFCQTLLGTLVLLEGPCLEGRLAPREGGARAPCSEQASPLSEGPLRHWCHLLRAAVWV